MSGESYFTLNSFLQHDCIHLPRCLQSSSPVRMVPDGLKMVVCARAQIKFLLVPCIPWHAISFSKEAVQKERMGRQIKYLLYRY